MESYRILAQRVDVDGMPVEVDYAAAFVVVREGAVAPATTDWEVNLRTGARHHLEPARHDVALHIPDGTVLRGVAIVRFSDGHSHLLRGDSRLDGFQRDQA